MNFAEASTSNQNENMISLPLKEKNMDSVKRKSQLKQSHFSEQYVSNLLTQLRQRTEELHKVKDVLARTEEELATLKKASCPDTNSIHTKKVTFSGVDIHYESDGDDAENDQLTLSTLSNNSLSTFNDDSLDSSGENKAAIFETTFLCANENVTGANVTISADGDSCCSSPNDHNGTFTISVFEDSRTSSEVTVEQSQSAQSEPIPVPVTLQSNVIIQDFETLNLPSKSDLPLPVMPNKCQRWLRESFSPGGAEVVAMEESEFKHIFDLLKDLTKLVNRSKKLDYDIRGIHHMNSKLFT